MSNTNAAATAQQTATAPAPHTVDSLTAMLQKLDAVETTLKTSLEKLGASLSAAEQFALHKLNDERKAITAAIVTLIHRG